MNKIIIYILLVLLVTGCNKKEEVEIESTTIEDVVKEEYVDNNPVVVGLYDDINLIKEYNTIKQSFKDLVFSVYFTNEENLGNSNQKSNWIKYYNNYNNIDNVKIGFSFSFDTTDGKVEKVMLEPGEYICGPYFYVYLYDDINQPDDTFYSHIEQVNENTIFSSIKLYLLEVDKITSPIYLTVFTYDTLDDFDEFGKYKGNSKYTIKINLQ